MFAVTYMIKFTGYPMIVSNHLLPYKVRVKRVHMQHEQYMEHVQLSQYMVFTGEMKAFSHFNLLLFHITTIGAYQKP